MKVFAHNLRRMRKEAGLSQEGLAELAELTQVTISQLERSKENISLYAIDRLAAALKCEAFELLKPE